MRCSERNHTVCTMSHDATRSAHVMSSSGDLSEYANPPTGRRACAAAGARSAGLLRARWKKSQAELRGLVGKAIADYGMIGARRSRDGMPVGRQGFVHDARYADEPAAPRAGRVFDRGRESRSKAAGLSGCECCRSTSIGLAIEYRIVEEDTYSIVKRVVPEGKTTCGLCSRLRRGVLYRIAEEIGATRIALGHHRDDIVETLFLNMFYGGRLKAMPPKLRSDDGRHIVIRPLAYCSEQQIAQYARQRKFPIIPCNLCGSQENLKRREIKALLADWEQRDPGRTDRLFRAVQNVTSSHLADRALFSFTDLEAVASEPSPP